MKRLFLVALGALPLMVTGQTLLYNDGAMIKVQPGATLYVEGGIHNTTTGTIDNDGTIEMKGNLINEGTWEASQANTLKFSGNVSSQVSPGSAVFYNVVVAKESGSHVNLALQNTATGHMTISNNLLFDNTKFGKIVTGNYDVKLQSGATVTTPDADQYVATTGTGMMEKAVTANGSFTFPIGDVDNYSPLASTYTGSGYAAANIRTKANDLVHPNKPADATEFITRYWDVNATGITAYNNTLTGTYVPADLTLGGGGLASQVKGAVYDGAEWSYAGAASGANIVIGSTDDAVADFTGTNFFGKVNLRVLLAGAYNTGTGLMTTTLNTSNLIPLNSPYADAPASVGAIPANVTDWVKIELRDPVTPSTILGKGSLFVKNNGDVVALDGTSLPSVKNGLPVSVVGVVHRNHLFVRTPNAGINVINPTLHDFSDVLANAYDNAGVTTNDALRLMSNGKYAMWAGNANTVNATATSQIRYAGLNNDLAAILSALGGNTATILNNVYLAADLNLNGVVRYAGLNNDPAVLLTNLSNNTANIFTHHQ